VEADATDPGAEPAMSVGEDTTMEQNGHPEEDTPVPGPARWGLEALAGDLATYRACRSEMVKEQEGQYVLIREGAIIGFFRTRSKAIREGYRRFGIVPFLVKEVTATDRAIYLPNVVP
jgi:hypothetical protein